MMVSKVPLMRACIFIVDISFDFLLFYSINNALHYRFQCHTRVTNTAIKPHNWAAKIDMPLVAQRRARWVFDLVPRFGQISTGYIALFLPNDTDTCHCHL